MIQLNQDSLIFQTADGERIPCSAETVTIELIGDAARGLDEEVIKNASAAVLHYFKFELKREFVSVSEFSEALERVLRSFGLSVSSSEGAVEVPKVFEADLARIAGQAGQGCELFFFTNLRAELNKEEARTRPVVRFHGLRQCVKQLIGTRRWTFRCEQLSDDIVRFLRGYFHADGPATDRALIIV